MTFVAGALPPMTEARFQKQVTDLAELFGWRWYHTRRSEKSPAGFPDLVLVRARHPHPRVIFAELKAQRTPVTTAQRTWHQDLVECGAEAYIFRPSDWKSIERTLR